MTQVLKRLFGVVTVRVSFFEGRGRKRLGIPSTYFSRDCLKDRADNPINKMCAERVLKMARLVLAGKADYDLRDFSRALRDMPYDLFGVETMDFVIEAEGDPDRDVKAKAQVAFLRHVLQEAQGKAEVDVASVAAALGVYVNSKVGRSPGLPMSTTRTQLNVFSPITSEIWHLCCLS